MATFYIKRMYAFGRPYEVLKRGLTEEEAQEHCKDPETSSKTCSTREGRERTRKYGPWFDGYDEE